MKRIVSGLLVLIIVFSVFPSAFAYTDLEDLFSVKVPSRGTTFQSLYNQMCVDLSDYEARQIRSQPLSKASDVLSGYGTRDTDFYEWIISVSDHDIQTVGYGVNGNHYNYLTRNVYCYHEHGEYIRFTVFYYSNGQYCGNIKWDLTNGNSTSSHKCPFYGPGHTTNLK